MPQIHALLTFVSTVSSTFIKSPIPFDLQGQTYVSIQTNETAIVYMHRYLKNQGLEEGLSRLFLIASTTVETGTIDCEAYESVKHYGKVL